MKRPLFCAATLALLAGWHPASAQEHTIEEVVVTAQKRESTLQSTPIAITALTVDDISDGQIDDLRAVQFLSPNLVFNTIGGTTNLYLRGIGTDINDSLAEPGVALYVNGVYQGVTGDQSAIYNDLERIEVLRGPQGTLYGRNSTGGNIHLYTKQPGFDPGMEASLLAGRFGRMKASFAAQGTLIEDRVAVRGNIVVDQDDGVRDNPATGKDIDERDLTSGALGVLFKLSDTAEFVLRGDWTERDDDTPRWDYIEVVPDAGLNPVMFGGTAVSGGEKINNDSIAKYETDIWGVSGTLTWELDNVTVKSIVAYRESDWGGPYDNDGTDIPFLNAIPTQESDQLSAEIDIVGKALEERLDWIVGFYYFTQESLAEYTYTLPVLQTFFEQVIPDIQGGFVPPLPPGGLADPTRNPVYGERINGGMPSAIPFNDFHTEQDTDSAAVFAQTTYHLSNSTRATAGVRYTEDDKEVEQSWVSNIHNSGCVDLRQDDDWSELTWKAGLDHDLSDETMVYAHISKGFHAGGFNGGSCGDVYDPETLIAYEAGLKTLLADGRLQLNLAGFYYDYDDYQARLFIGGSALIQNATEATVSGLEAEFLWHPLPGFEIDGSIAWLDGEFDKFSSDNPMTPDPTIIDLKDNKLLRSPEYSFNLGMQYTHAIGETASLTGRYEIAYKDDYYMTIFNDDFAEFESNTIQNFRLIWSDGRNWQVQAFVENLTDEEYLEARVATPSIGGIAGMWAPPRTWGAQVRYTMGAY